ncbi:MAG: hypothetical protein KGM16_00270 [Bacteroidota bacterium]|nr:hypothetical protein [Bacteroidota bacterium]
MEQNNFEKKVQQKMDELKIPPPDLVWVNIEKKIGKKEKGKRGIILFFFFFLFLLCGGYWLMDSVKNDSKSNESKENVVKKDSKTTNINDSSSHQLVANEPSNKGSINQLNLKSNTISLPQETFDKKKSLYRKPTNIIDSSSHQKLMNNSIEKGFKNNKNTKAKIVKHQHETVSENKIKADQQNAYPQIEVASNQPKNPENTKEEEEVKKPNKKITPIVVQNNIGSNSATINESAQNKVATATIKDSSSIEKSLPANKKNPWIVGITLSGGNSWISNSSPSTNNIAYTSPGNSGTGTYYSAPSSLKSSIAFMAGIFFEKNISDKNKISFGISYQYFSLINKVGKVIISPTYAQAFNSSGNIYSADSTISSYRNNFHFLEVPVSFSFQVNKSKKVPLFWNVGINISELISTNALQFQSNPGIYYKDNSLLNKTQFGLHTGFSVMLFAKKTTPLTVGSYFYYNPTNISIKGLYRKRHFNFIGIQAKVLFRKK